MGNNVAKLIDNEANASNLHPNAQNTAKYTDRAPFLLTKKWLCAHFGLIRPCGQAYYKGLYKHVLTADVLAAAGIDIEVVRHRKLKTFDRTSSMRLIEILGLQA